MPPYIRQGPFLLRLTGILIFHIQEKAALEQGKRPKAEDGEGTKLLKTLVDQIDSQIMRLKRVRHARREELEKRRPATLASA